MSNPQEMTVWQIPPVHCEVKLGTKCDYRIIIGDDHGKLFAEEIKND
jgi:hypothetical protein